MFSWFREQLKSSQKLLVGFRRAISIAIRWAGGFAIVIAIAIFSLIVYAKLVNWDLENRLTEVQSAPLQFSNGPEPDELDPMLHITLHRILPEEGTVKMSADLKLSSKLVEQMKREQIGSIAAEIHDATGLGDYLLPQKVRVELSSTQSGYQGIAASTPKFEMPFFPSVSSFPFDKTVLLISPLEWKPTVGYYSPIRIEVERMVPGRVMTLSSEGGNLKVELSRSPIEQIFVIVSAAVFSVLSLTIAGTIVFDPKGLSGTEGMLAVAGFIVASSGFRDLLGVPKVTGITVLEMLTFGLPFLLLTSAILISTWIRRFGTSTKKLDVEGF